MADDITIADKNDNAKIVATDETTYSGDTAHVQLVRLVHVTGVEGAKVVGELVKAEDAAHASGDFGFQLLAVRKDTAAALSDTDGDYTPLIVDSAGRLHVVPVQTNPANFQNAPTAVAIVVDKAYTVDTRNAITQLPNGRLRVADARTAISADTTIANENYSSAQTNNALVSAPGSNKRLVVVEIMFSHDTAGSIALVEDTGGTPVTKWGPHYQAANGTISHQCYIPITTNKDLGATTTGAGNATISVRTITESL